MVNHLTKCVYVVGRDVARGTPGGACAPQLYSQAPLKAPLLGIWYYDVKTEG